MSLILGKSFDRSYDMRIPFLDGYYDLGVFFSKKSSFLLFSIDSSSGTVKRSAKINMFKNLEASMFCETFLNLHNYRKSNLDIINQFDSIRSEYSPYVSLSLNEGLTLQKVKVNDKEFFDTLTIYGFSILSHFNEFIFVIAERQNIIKRLDKKVVRSTGLQISTTSSLQVLEEFHEDSVKGKEGTKVLIPSSEVVTLED
jgi:hypothetical protein